MASAIVNEAVAEIENGRIECLQLLTSIQDFYSPAEGEDFPPTFRLIVTPMLYSAWERCFTLCHEVGLRLIRDTVTSPMTLGATNRAVWLIGTPFYQSLVAKLKNQSALDEESGPKKGHFVSLCEFLHRVYGLTGC